jgi:hypothetical protein
MLALVGGGTHKELVKNDMGPLDREGKVPKVFARLYRAIRACRAMARGAAKQISHR